MPNGPGLKQRIDGSFGLLWKQPNETPVVQKARQKNMLLNLAVMTGIFEELHHKLQELERNDPARNNVIQAMEYCYLSLYIAFAHSIKDATREQYGRLMMRTKRDYSLIFDNTIERHFPAVRVAFFQVAANNVAQPGHDRMRRQLSRGC